MKSLGYHLILELEGCPEASLNDPEMVSRVMIESVKASGATMIQPFFHQFAPQGVSGVVIISESHFSIHTWPEYGYAAVDIFTCGDQIDMDVAADTIRRGFKADSLVPRSSESSGRDDSAQTRNLSPPRPRDLI